MAGESKNSSPVLERETARGPSREYEGILNEIEAMIAEPENLAKQKIKDFTERRAKVLNERTDPTSISFLEHSFYFGYIHPESKIYRVRFLDPFFLDDDETHTLLLETIREIKLSDAWKNKTLREIIPPAVCHSLVKYFGNVLSTENEERKNEQFYMDSTTLESEGVSLKELKGKGFAVCAEKAALAQNFLTFLGIDSYLVLSIKCKLAEETGEGHAYNIIVTPRGHFIFDAANPATSRKETTGEIISYWPAFYKVTQEQFEDIKNGGTVEILHKDILVSEDGSTQEKISKREYGGP